MRGARAPGWRVARAFLGLFTALALFIVLGRLALGPGPIGVVGLDRLARGTEPKPMVPTSFFYYIYKYRFFLNLVNSF